jgi:translation initiation factor IF-2
MAGEKSMRLGQASRKLNVGHNTILDFLAKKGHEVENNPNAKLTPEQVALLSKEYATSANEKQEASELTIGGKHSETITIKSAQETPRKKDEDEQNILIKNLGSQEVVHKEETPPEKIKSEKPKLGGLKVVGKIETEKPKKKEEKPAEETPVEKPEEAEVKSQQELIKAKADKLHCLMVLYKISLPAEK